jgi:hypothetical protein
MRRLFRLSLGLLFGGTLVAVACDATDLSSLESGVCPAGEKACFVSGKEQCVGMSDPMTGCNALNCVSCDVKVANAVARCSSSTSTCTIAACNPGYLDCDKLDSDGCEVDDQTDIGNCGLCGTVCAVEPQSEPLCLDGVCALRCSDGYADCDGKYSTGCEAQLGADAKNCGGCGAGCSAGQECVDSGCM